MSTEFAEVVPQLRARSEVVYLDFREIPFHYPPYKNIQLFFEQCQRLEKNPRLPEQRQNFNDQFLQRTGQRYLIGRYLEERSAMLEDSFIDVEEGTIHLGIDIFSKDLEPVYAPDDGTVVLVGDEQGEWGYGNYLILEHQMNSMLWYSFFGHLSTKSLPNPGRFVPKGEQLGMLGDHHENGGWSRHLHYQILRPPADKSATIGVPVGYCRKENIEEYKRLFPDSRLVVGKLY